MKEIKLGDQVIDNKNNQGVVVKITPYVDENNPGVVSIWLSNKWYYDTQNCDHYPIKNWEQFLKIL